MAYNKFIKKDGTVMLDLTGDTVTADTLRKGVIAHDKYGEPIEGTGRSVIDVEELPTENVDTAVLYKCGDHYYQYVEGTFRDIIAVSDGEVTSFIELYTQLLGVTPELYQIKTKPTTEEGLAEIVITNIDAGVIAIYYIEDEADAAVYDGSAWSPMETTGVIGDISEVTEDGMYVLGGSYWTKYIAPRGGITITENSTVDVTDKVSVTVNIPATYIVENSADLPTDAPANSIAIVLRG